MKRIISATTFPQTGSGAKANRRQGQVKFGHQETISLYEGVLLSLTTAKCIVDVDTGKVSTSLNFYISANRPVVDGISAAEFYAYTPEEFEELYRYVQTLSLDELLVFIKDNESY